MSTIESSHQGKQTTSGNSNTTFTELVLYTQVVLLVTFKTMVSRYSFSMAILLLVVLALSISCKDQTSTSFISNNPDSPEKQQQMNHSFKPNSQAFPMKPASVGDIQKSTTFFQSLQDRTAQIFRNSSTSNMHYTSMIAQLAIILLMSAILLL